MNRIYSLGVLTVRALIVVTMTGLSSPLPTRGWMSSTVRPADTEGIPAKTKKFLEEYGYVVTASPPLERRQPQPPTSQPLSFTTGTITKTGSPRNHDSEEFSEAIRFFQERFHLPVTGLLDRTTLDLINKPRCGVSDLALPSYPVKLDRLLHIPSHETDNYRLGFVWTTTTPPEGSLLPSRVTHKSTSTINPEDRTTLLKSSSVSKLVGDGNTGPNDGSINEWSQSVAMSINEADSQSISNFHDVDDSTMSESRSAKSIDTELTTGDFRTELVTDTMTTIIDDLIYEEDSNPIKSTFQPTGSDLKISTTPSDLAVSSASTRTIVSRLSLESQRGKRGVYASTAASDLIASEVGLASRITGSVIRWRILDVYCSGHFTSCDGSRDALRFAFRRWSEVTPLTFREQRTGDILNVHIQIAFLTRDTSLDFGIELHEHEYARYQETPGGINLFFQDDIQWTNQSGRGFNLHSVAVHEIGHVLGLNHNDSFDSTMYPFYNERYHVDTASRRLAQRHYGNCSGSFDAAFDIVKSNNGQLRYKSYFLRDHSVWLYNNNWRRPRRGDPRNISAILGGVPGDADVILQIRPHRISTSPVLKNFKLHLYVFKGARYWRLNNNDGRAYVTDPDSGISYQGGRPISEGWPALPGRAERIPDNLDAAYFDQRDNNIYFFKNSQVYAYDLEAGGCCAPGYPRPISEAYPGHTPTVDSLPNHIDAAYYSIYHRALYFFKGDYFWENVTYNPSSRRVVNRVNDRSKWNTKWWDICDV